MSEQDTRSKEQLKRDGEYTPQYWRKLKAQRGWSLEAHGQNRPPKWRESNAGQRTGKRRGVSIA